MQTHTAQKLRRISELKGEKICISYETKIFHVWSISYYLIYLFIYFSIRTNSKDKMIFSRLSVFKILLFLQQPLHTQLIICMTLQALWIDMTWSTNTCSLTSYKLRTKEIIKTVKHSSLNLAVKIVPTPLYCIDWFMQRVLLGGHFNSPLQVPFLCLI